ncbi:MAG: hypothetical protein WCL21_11800 [Mariniphaga sp.]
MVYYKIMPDHFYFKYTLIFTFIFQRQTHVQTNTITYKSIIDTPDLRRQENRKRTARIIYFGFTYNFGGSGKKQNGDALKYDNKM